MAVVTRTAPEIYVADIERAENGSGGAITLFVIKTSLQPFQNSS